MKRNFYCTNVNGHPDFSIDEWNKEFQRSIELGYEMKDTLPCKKQCEDCKKIVLKRQKETFRIKKK